MNVETLKKHREKKFKRDLPVYTKFIQKVHKRIEEYDKLNATDYLCEIPYVIIGEPTYNQNDANKLLCDTLKNGGYNIAKINDSWVYINWAHVNLQTKTKNIDKRLNSEYKKQKTYITKY